MLLSGFTLRVAGLIALLVVLGACNKQGGDTSSSSSSSASSTTSSSGFVFEFGQWTTLPKETLELPVQTEKPIFAGYTANVVLNQFSEVIAWGRDARATPPNGERYRSVGLIRDYVYAITEDGEIAQWSGSRRHARLPEPQSPVADFLPQANMYLLEDGRLQAWDSTYSEMLDSPNNTINNLAAIDSEALNDTRGFAVLLRQNGTLGVLGDSHYAPPDNISRELGFKAIAAGSQHALALRSDGVVVAWGSNTEGQLDVPDGLTEVIAIDASNTYSVALKSDGTVVEWGGRASSQFKPMPEGLDDVTHISASRDHTLIIRKDGSIDMWGNDAFFVNDTPQNLSNIERFEDSGPYLFLHYKDSSALHWKNGPSWVDIPEGRVIKQLAGKNHNIYTQSQLDMLKARKLQPMISPSPLARFSRVYAVYEDGSLSSLADNPGEQVPNAEGIDSIHLLGDGALGLKSDGTIVCWSKEHCTHGELISGFENIKTLHVLDDGFIAITQLGELKSWGQHRCTENMPLDVIDVIEFGYTHQIAFSRSSTLHYCYALRSDGGLSDWSNIIHAPLGLTDIRSVTATGGLLSTMVALAAHSDGSLTTWGNILWEAETDEELLPPEIPSGLPPVETVGSTTSSTLWAIHRDGSLSIWSGIGGTLFPSPYADYRAEIRALSGVQAVVAYNRILFALTAEDNVLSFGTHYIGENLYSLLPE